MRPAFKYIDKIDEKFKAANKRIQDAEKSEEQKSTPPEAKAQAVQVRESVKLGTLGFALNKKNA